MRTESTELHSWARDELCICSEEHVFCVCVRNHFKALSGFNGVKVKKNSLMIKYRCETNATARGTSPRWNDGSRWWANHFSARFPWHCHQPVQDAHTLHTVSSVCKGFPVLVCSRFSCFFPCSTSFPERFPAAEGEKRNRSELQCGWQSY